MSASKGTQRAPDSYVPSSSTYSYQGEQPPPYPGAPPLYNPPKSETAYTQQYQSFSDINPEIASDTTPLISSPSFDDQTVKKGFVRKVFSIVAIQLLFTCTVVCVFTFCSVVKEGVQSHLWAYLSSFIVFLVVVIALNCCKSFSRQHPWNIVALFVITVSFSFMMGTIASYHNTAAVIITMGATLVISITIMVFSVQNRFDFNICNSILLVVVVDIALFGIFCSFYYTYIAEVIYGCLGALLFSVRITELEAEGTHHVFFYVDEAGFNLCEVRRRGRNLIGHRAAITVPGQRGVNITMCAAISNDGVLCHIPTIGPYNTERLVAFPNALHDILILPQERGLLGPGMPLFVIIWDNVAFHHSRVVNEWFAVHPRMMVQFRPPYSPFLNPIEEFFSAWRWKVYDHRPYEQMPLLNAMTAAAQDIDAEACQGWIRHARRFFPRCIARENIECDVDEAMWPILQERRDRSVSLVAISYTLIV